MWILVLYLLYSVCTVILASFTFLNPQVQFLKALTQDSLTDEEKSHEEEKHVTFSKKEHAHQDPQVNTPDKHSIYWL